MSKTKDVALLDWLRTTGYPFQMQTGREIRQTGWFVTYSRWYRDPESEKPREIDLEAIAGTGVAGEAYFFVHLVIECKVTNSPWVGIRAADERSPLTFSATSPGAMSRRFAHASELLEITLPVVLPLDTPEVDAVISGFGDKQDIRGSKQPKASKPKDSSDPTSPYAAVMQTVSATKARDSAMLATALNGLPGFHTATLVLPIVVVKGPLYTYTLGADLNDKLSQANAFVVRVPADEDSEYALAAVVSDTYARAILAPAFTEARRFTKECLEVSGRIAHSLQHPLKEIAGRLRTDAV